MTILTYSVSASLNGKLVIRYHFALTHNILPDRIAVAQGRDVVCREVFCLSHMILINEHS